jgi:hypothetical protein
LKVAFSLGDSGVETMYRICMGGGEIGRKEDPRLWRKWDSETDENQGYRCSCWFGDFDLNCWCGFEGPEKATRGGVNGSQSKFLTGIWPMSQNQPETTLF